jgi:hypothetical protein
MTYRGTFRKGVVVLERGVTLADGTAVEVRLLTGTARKRAGSAKASNKSPASKRPAKSGRRAAGRQGESSVDRIAREQGVTRVVPFDELLGGWPQGQEQDGFEDAVDRWRAEEPRRGEF